MIINLHSNVAASGPVISSFDRESGAPLTLYFTHAELDAYVAYRSEGMAKKSKDWIIRSSVALWESTKGEISHQTVTGLRTFVLDKYQSRDSHSKVLSFSIGFLNFLAQTKIDPTYLSFKLFLEMPKRVKLKRHLQRGLSLAKTSVQCFSGYLSRKKKEPILRRYVITARLR